MVGERSRSADIRRYLEWRIKNPNDPLPGEWRGPVKKVRAETPGPKKSRGKS